MDPDGRTTWLATEIIFMGGFDFRLADVGITGMLGKAYVVFTNEDTQESISQWYDIVTVNSLGLNAFAGGSAGITFYEKSFSDDATKEDILSSYEGIFANITCPQLALFGGQDLYGFSATSSVVIGMDLRLGFFGNDTPWVGLSFSASFNLMALLPGPSIPSYSLSFSIYKLPENENGKTDWSNPEYEQYFLGARLFSNQLTIFDLPKLTEEAIQLIE